MTLKQPFSHLQTGACRWGAGVSDPRAPLTATHPAHLRTVTHPGSSQALGSPSVLSLHNVTSGGHRRRELTNPPPHPPTPFTPPPHTPHTLREQQHLFPGCICWIQTGADCRAPTVLHVECPRRLGYSCSGYINMRKKKSLLTFLNYHTIFFSFFSFLSNPPAALLIYL